MSRIRTIKPEFWTHEALSALPEATHLLAAALLCYADDEGYFNAHPKLVQAQCCPLREPSVTIQCSLDELSRAGFLVLGTGADGKRYGHVVNFLVHQRINRSTPSVIKQLPIVWAPCVIAHVPLSEPSVSAHGVLTEGSHPEWKGTEGKGNGMEQEPSLRSGSCPVLKIADASPVVLKIPLAGKDPPPEFGITRQMLDEWGALFPGVDVQQALQSCRAWNLANPRNRKTQGGVLRHVTAWLSREQDRSRPGGGGAVVALPARGLGRQAAIEAANQQAAQEWARAGTDPEAAHVSA